MSRKSIIILFIFLSLFIPFCGDAWADPVSNGNMQASAEIFDSVVQKITDSLSTFGEKAREYGLYLLGAFMLINLVWRYGSLIFRGNSISDLFFEFIRTIMIYGFFLWFLTNLPEFTNLLLQGFSKFAQSIIGGSGGAVTGNGVSASACVDMGIDSFIKLVTSVQPPETDGISGTLINCFMFLLAAFVAIVIGFIIIILWLFIAVNIVLVTVSYYFIAYCGAFMLGFAGTEWTRNTALAYLNALLGAAVKFFGTFMIAGLISKVAQDCIASFSQSGNGFTEGFLIPPVTLLVVSLVGYLLADKLPNMLASIISPATNGAGVSVGGFAGATGLNAAAKNMAGAALAMAGAATAMAGSGVSKVTNALKDSLASHGMDGASAMVDKAGSVASNVGSGMKSVLGNVMHATGHSGMKTNMNINEQMASSNIREQFLKQGLSQGKSQGEAEKYADQQTDAFSRSTKANASRMTASGMSPSAAATRAMRDSCGSFGVSYGGENSSQVQSNKSSTQDNTDNTISSGGSNSGNFNDGATQGSSFNNTWGKAAQEHGDSAGAPENAYQNIKDVYKDPVDEDPSTDMNFQGPEHKN